MPKRLTTTLHKTTHRLKSSLRSVDHEIRDSYKEYHAKYTWDRGISRLRRDMLHSPLGHPNRLDKMQKLARCLSWRFYMNGRNYPGNMQDARDIDEAIKLQGQVLSHIPLDDPRRPGLLDGLASFLEVRWLNLGDLDDLEESIVYRGTAVKSCARGSSDRNFQEGLLSDVLKIRDEVVNLQRLAN